MNNMNRRVFLGAAAMSAATLSTLSNAAEPAAGSVKIVGLAGSLRKGKTTYKAVELALESAKTVSPAIATELIELSGLNLDPYVAVGSKSSDRPDDFPAVRGKLEAPNTATGPIGTRMRRTSGRGIGCASGSAVSIIAST